MFFYIIFEKWIFTFRIIFFLLADDERAVRRESYLKATEGGRMHFDGDLSDGDVSPHVLRRWVSLRHAYNYS